MAITQSVLGTSTSAIYTSTGQSVVQLLYFCNTSGSTKTVNLYVVPSGGSASNSTIVYYNYPIVSTDTLVVSTEKIILSNGDAIHANANASSSITTTVGYINL
jgi:hypothetical protein